MLILPVIKFSPLISKELKYYRYLFFYFHK